MANRGQLIEFSAELRARASGIFEQNRELRVGGELLIYSSPGERHGFGNVEHPLLHSQAFVIAGVSDEIFGADEESALDFSAERIDGFFPNDRWRRGEIDQVTVVNDERGEIVPVAQLLEAGDLF